MTHNGTHPYYRKIPDTFMWSEFDALAARLRLSASTALSEAARAWVEEHRDDPTPPIQVKVTDRPRHPEKPYPPDPFAQ